MNRRLYSTLAAVAVLLALFIGFGAFNTAKAVPGTSGEQVIVPTAGVNQFGVDAANNSPGSLDKDAAFRGSRFAPDTYGLYGTLRQ